MSGKVQGRVNWFSVSRGYGFITREDDGQDIFVHQSDLHAEGFRSLGDGEVVEFNVEAVGDGRLKAVDVSGPSGAFVQGAPRRPYRNRGGEGGGKGGGRGEGGSEGGPKGRGRGGGRGGGRGRGRKGEGGDEGQSSGLQVVVLNLPFSTSGDALHDLFAGVGQVEAAEVVCDDRGTSRGFGTVRFTTQEAAKAAVDKHTGTEVEGRPITVRIDKFA